MIDQTFQRSGNICAGGHQCQVWTAPGEGCRQGFCNSEDAEVCYSALQIAGWTEQAAKDREPSGVSLVPDVTPFVEVYLTAPLPQQKPDSRIASINSKITHTTMSVDDFKAEIAKVASSRAGAEKRQASGVSFSTYSSRSPATITSRLTPLRRTMTLLSRYSTSAQPETAAACKSPESSKAQATSTPKRQKLSPSA